MANYTLKKYWDDLKSALDHEAASQKVYPIIAVNQEDEDSYQH